MKYQIFLIVSIFATVKSLENGLARTPPMGWMNWQRYRCETNCEKYPDECISENLFKTIANKMVSDGYLDAGYEYIIVDDCWSAMERDEDGKLVGDPIRFPSGMKALADYVHDLGLKFGLYGDYGTLTCGGYPGSLDYLELDAQTYASWGVDYVKLDGCYSDIATMEEGYAEYGKYLNATGRPIVYSCSWPAYEETSGIFSNYDALARTCNLWRNYGDIQDSWETVRAITAWFVEHQERLRPHSAPGHWNDPDMLIIGDFGLSFEQSKAQMTIWSLMAAPLIMSNDLVNIAPEMKDILLNKEAIKINQDSLGIQGEVIINSNNIEVWRKPILDGNSFGLGFISYRDDGTKYPMEYSLEALGLNDANGYDILDVFTGEEWIATKNICVRVAPSGAVFLKATVKS